MSSAARHQYWRFYWPLALTGLVSLLAGQIQNATLARYPDAARELATFAVAAGVFHLFDSALIFVPQMVNALGRSPAAARICLNFVLLLSAVLTLPLLILAVPAIGGPVVGTLFNISGATLKSVLLYLALLSPNIFLAGLRHYFTGQIIAARHTAVITVLNTFFLAVILSMLVVGFHAGWRPIITLGVAQISASLLHMLLLWAASRRWSGGRLHPQAEKVSYRDVFDFFWPVALTSIMFSLSRPILYSYVGRLDNPAPVIATLRVGFDFAMIFHNLLNQFRHLFVTFGGSDLAGIRKFMMRVTAGVVGVMLVVVWTPLGGMILREAIGVPEELLVLTQQALLVLCALPVVVSLRNYFHGVAMIRRRTGPMGAGAVARNVATWLVCAALLASGWLNHWTAAGTLVIGFMAETLVVIVGSYAFKPPQKRAEAPTLAEEVRT